jgi:hypothetical protein
MRDWVNGV